MDLTSEIISRIGEEESSTLEYKAVLPPSRNIAQLICAFANTNGGYIVLGVNFDEDVGSIEVIGLSDDFHANNITHKAIDLVTPPPKVFYQYVVYQNKKIYVIKVDKSDNPPHAVEGRIYLREGSNVKFANPTDLIFKKNGFNRVKLINKQLEINKKSSTNSAIRLIEHYQSILKIIDDLALLLYPVNVTTPTANQEGKVLSRILFSSFVDNFETYLSDLLYEIFLANPSTLKSKQSVTLEEVLNCSDLQEFVKYWAKVKIGKLQKGSVRGFISENKQISDLSVLDDNSQNEIEKILQIRHLYSHRNGVVDEKFLQYFPTELIGSEHQMSITEICDKMEYLASIVNQIDLASSSKFKLVQGTS